MTKDRGVFSTYLVPFGRFTRATHAEHPANEVLIGREGQRAYLIDLLISLGKQGAYLVTGRRGAGKTIFVRECLTEYESAVLERTLRGPQGKGLWDHLSIGLIWAALIVGAALLSELTARLASIADNLTSLNYLLWVFLLPFVFIFLYPAIYAKEVLESILERGKMAKSSRAQNLSGILTAVFMVSVLLTSARSQPSLVIGRFWLVLSIFYLLGNSISFRRPKKKLTESLFLGITLLLTSLMVWFASTGTFIPQTCFLADVKKVVALSLMFFGAGNLARGLYQKRHLPRVSSRKQEIPSPSEKRQEQRFDKLGSAYKRGGSWYLVLGVGPIALALTWLKFDLSYVVAAVTSSVWALMMVTILHRPESPGNIRTKNGKSSTPFVPQPELVLGLKAGISVLLSIQLSAATLAQNSWLREFLPFLASDSSTFSDHVDEIRWIILVFGLVCLLTWIEYDWVVRPYLHHREDVARSPEPSGISGWLEKGLGTFTRREKDNVSVDRRSQREYYRQLAALTLPWITYRAWSPTVVVSVNLGFDRLDHRRVVQAMLAGLREEYHRKFLAWSSGISNVRHFLVALLLIFIATGLGYAFFGKPYWDAKKQIEGSLEIRTTDKAEISGSFWRDVEAVVLNPSRGDICDSINENGDWGNAGEPSIVSTLCSIPGDWFVEILYTSLVPEPLTQRPKGVPANLLFERMLPTEASGKLDLRVYHVATFLVLFLLAKTVLRLIPILPYSENLRRIDSVLEALASRTRTKVPRGLWKPARWIYGFFGSYETKESETDPVDARTVELAFLHVLEDLQQSGIRLPGSVRSRLSIPTPEITFIFDELDKLGSKTDPGSGHGSEVELTHDFEALSHERRRSQALIHLLSDLKNLLSSAPARFIFIAGRNLHDEWLADQTSRHPLLSSIFSAEVYLPSLLTDHQWRGKSRHDAYLTHRIEEYLAAQFERANRLQRRWLLSQARPFVSVPVTPVRPESFVQVPATSMKRQLPVINAESKQYLDLIHAGSFQEDLVIFLAHRSMGNPKKLQMLLSSFVRPTKRVSFGIPGESNWNSVLQFRDSDLVRLQLVASIHRQIVQPLESSLVKRDDKIVVSLLYLTDYLFKFHGRAFSWANLERVDELIHIHRAPDSRETLRTLVRLSAERYLHTVLNGMYAFRFRSDVAREIEYLSRQSPEEMAAFNFTLDESQALKALLSATLRSEPEENPDVLAGLGELYEFDEEFETARQYYRRAIGCLDQDIRRELGLVKEKSAWPSILSVLAGRPRGLILARLVLSWGTARLRLRLQIGMSWERAGNLERAEATYRDSRTLSKALLRSYLDEEGRVIEGIGCTSDKKEVVDDERIDALKHLNILFQAVFAEAWVMEKLPGGIDTSASQVERELAELRATLPFVRDPEMECSVDPANVQGSNFALITSQLHSKAGDLYFFKGKPALDLRDEIIMPDATAAKDGYLLQSHLHYCISLHELRRVLVHRQRSSRYKLCPAPSAEQRATVKDVNWSREATLPPSDWPDFVGKAAAGVISDVAETILSRVQLLGLLHEAKCLQVTSVAAFVQERGLVLGRTEDNDELERLSAQHRAWMKETQSPKAGPGRRRLGVEIDGNVLDVGTLDEWFGVWDENRNSRTSGRTPLVIFPHHPHNFHQRLLFALHLAVSAVDFYRNSGYFEDGGRELLQVAEAVSHYLWWYKTLYFLKAKQLLPPTVELPSQESTAYLVDHLFDLGVAAIERSLEFFRMSRRRSKRHDAQAAELRAKPCDLLDEIVPASAISILCSLGLSSVQDIHEDTDNHVAQRRRKIKELLNRFAEIQPVADADREALRRCLDLSTYKVRFPISNRLMALKVLLDEAAIHGSAGGRSLYVQANGLRNLSHEYASPLHFTPLMVGTSLALTFISASSGQQSKAREQLTDEELVDLRTAAEWHLRRSAEMYSHQRAYYEAIETLYYLYDDFNDRKLHFNQAIQMAGREICGLLRLSLRNESLDQHHQSRLF